MKQIDHELVQNSVEFLKNATKAFDGLIAYEAEKIKATINKTMANINNAVELFREICIYFMLSYSYFSYQNRINIKPLTLLIINVGYCTLVNLHTYNGNNKK